MAIIEGARSASDVCVDEEGRDASRVLNVYRGSLDDTLAKAASVMYVATAKVACWRIARGW
eukprot:8594338-Lingulodinium_polyedra.AAC.1